MRKLTIFVFAILILIGTFAFASALQSFYPTSSAAFVQSQYYQPSFQTYYTPSDIKTYWPALDDESCEARQDLILQVAPAGCQPVVVRSDLLADQNVPVFCQIDALQLNPLIDIEQIRNIRFKGEYPAEVVGTGFHPARAALNTRDKLLGSPLINNIGYAVVILKKNEKESSLPDSVIVNLSAQIEYDSGNALGIGRAEFLLSPLSDQDWQLEKDKQTFWQGRYSVRLNNVDPNFAYVSIYKGDQQISSTKVELGKLSNPIYVPGSYCRAGLQVSYDGLESAQTKARIEISDNQGMDTFDVYKGSYFLDNKCRVTNIVVNRLDNTGYVDASCASQRLHLVLNPNLISPSDYVSGELKNGLLTYYDEEGNPSYDQNIQSCEAYLDERSIPGNIGFYSIRRDKGSINDPWKLYYRQDRSKNTKDSNLEDNLKDEKNKWMQDLKNELIVKCDSKNELNIVKEKQYPDVAIEQYIKEAIDAYEKVAQDYPAEKEIDSPGVQTYGEKALSEAIDFAKSAGKQVTEARLINEFTQLYPDSNLVTGYQIELSSIYRVDSSAASNAIYVDNKYRTIRLHSITPPKQEQASAEFIIDGQHVTLEESKPQPFDAVNGKVILSLSPIRTPESATLQFNCNLNLNRNDYNNNAAYYRAQSNNFFGNNILNTQTLRIGEQQNICGKSVILEKVNSEQVAKIRLVPQVKGTQSETNLTVRIGIEKRAIELSPDKTKEKIDNLNESIQKFETISENLGKVVTGLKGACLATGAVLTAKNFLLGLDGTAIARTEVMRGDEGWTNLCKNAIAKHEVLQSGHTSYVSLDDCFNQNALEINKDVESTKKAIESFNNDIKNIQSGKESSTGSFGGLLGDKSVNTDGVKKDLAKLIRDKYGSENIEVSKGWIVYDADGKPTKETRNSVPVSEILDDKNLDSISYSELRSVYLNLEREKTGGSSFGEKGASSLLEDSAERINSNLKSYNSYKLAQEATKKGEPAPVFVSPSGANKIIAQVVPIGNVKNVVFKDQPSSPFLSKFVASGGGIVSNGNQIKTSGGDYYVSSEQTDKGYLIKEVFIKEGDSYRKLSFGELNDFRNVYNVGFIESADNVNYHHKFLNPEVKYYETEPYKGMPAIVPFDLDNGWYAATKQTLPALGGIGAFDASGRVASFWLCNVGENGQANFEESGFGDDICQSINLNTGQTYGVFSNLGEAEARTLVNKGVNALQEAARQYGSKSTYISIGRERVPVGRPAVNIPASQCQDFMSPGDCQILFNLCDPVICPTSRCNLGGTYYVSDVVQSGIVGSALLCLPNIKEGIYVPVCLTGIKAGIDAYVSILKDFRDCLQTNLDTGATVGICDQVTSVYLCEFFWRQVAPIANIILPKLAASAYGQGTRGGGEYLTVMAAWDNAKKSVDYFTQVYGANSLKAFQARSIEEAGGEFCRAFVSAKAPTAFKTLLEADSPPQFYARFSSIISTTATVPATAQYKVYYHIFAGNDAGIYYRVYLKSPPESSYYTSAPIVPIDGGFIVKGESKDEAKDLTAPEGYKQVCVDINGREECGFGQVSTDFGVNYLRDIYVKGQIEEKDVTSDQECVSGSPDVNALLANTNPEAAFGDAALPQIYNRGIIRICATQNPGASTNLARFVDVGYCGDQKVRCWLDKNSVNNAITDGNAGLKNATLEELGNYTRQNLEREGSIFSDNDAAAVINDLKSKKNQLATEVEIQRGSGSQNIDKELALLNNIKNVFDKLYLNHHKAQVKLIEAEVREIIAKVFLPEQIKSAGSSRPSAETEAFAKPEGSGSQNILTLQVGTVKFFGSEKNVNFIYSNGQRLDIYILDNAVYIGNENVNVEDSVQVGTVTNNVISLDSSHREEVDGLVFQLQSLYEEINGATVSGDTLIKLYGFGGSISSSGGASGEVGSSGSLVLALGDLQTSFFAGDYKQIYYNGEPTRVYIQVNSGNSLGEVFLIPGSYLTVPIGEVQNDIIVYYAEGGNIVRTSLYSDNPRVAFGDTKYYSLLNNAHIMNNNPQQVNYKDILTLSEDYSPSKKIDILYHDQPTGIYLLDSRVYRNDGTVIGTIGLSVQKIKILPSFLTGDTDSATYIQLNGASISGKDLIK